MNFGRYALGFLALLAICGSLGLGATALRARLLPGWRLAPARLAEAVIAFALLLAILELLGAVGLFRLGPIVAVCVAAGLALRRAGSRAGVGATGGAAGHPLARALAAATVGVVFAEWIVPTLHSYDTGIRSFDSLWYHLPWAATFAQTGHVTPFHFTDVEYLTAFYPASAELLHGLGIVLFGNDLISPGLNLVFLGLTLLAAWCIGSPRRLAAATTTGAALALAVPMMRFSQAGSAANDIVGVFFLLAAAALIVWARETDARAAWALAAVAAGSAVAVKLSLLAPVLALAVGAIALAGRARWRKVTGTWIGLLLLAGGFWYVRNLIAVGNPLPWVSAGLPTPSPPLQAHTDFAVAHYLFDGRIWDHFFAPGLAAGLGSWWAVIVVLAIGGPMLCVLRGREPATRVLGLVALVSLVAYLFTPEGAAGPANHPLGFAFNLRYAAPALSLSLAVLPLAAERDGSRARGAVLVALAVVFAVTVSPARLWPGGYSLPGWIVGAVVAVITGGLMAGRRRLVPVLLALAIAAAGLGYTGERHYLRGRYVYEPGVSSLAHLWDWFRGVHHARVALAGTFGGFFSYPLFGIDASNRVQYIARRGAHGSFTPVGSCAEWRRTVNAGHYRYVVTTPGRDPWHPRKLTSSPESAWTSSDPAARLVFSSKALGQRISVYELHGALSPSC